MQRLTKTLRQFARDDTQGAATLEFVLLLPFFLIIVFMTVEVGILTGRTVLLKRGVSIATRDIQLGINQTVDEEQFRRTVCSNAFLIDTCFADLKVEMIRIDNTIGQNRGAVACRNRIEPDLEPAVAFEAGGSDDIILVRACLIVDPVFPGTGLGASLARDELGGGYAIIAKSAFQNE